MKIFIKLKEKTKIILIIILVALTTALAGCGTVPSSTVPEMVNLESTLYVITGENYVGGVMNFGEELESFYGPIGLLGGHPLVEGIGEYLESIRECNSILVLPPTSEGIQEFQDLEDVYPDLCPLSSGTLESELDSYSSPLLYFSQDLQAEKLRGVIVVSQIDSSLAELLSEGVPLDLPFRYESGQLQILDE